MNKMRKNIPFQNLDLNIEFDTYTGKADGISEKVLSDDMNMASKTGKRTRLLRLDAGAKTPSAHAHDYWEEIYVIEGSMIEGTPEDGETRVSAPAYACRKPGFLHGPVRTDEPCLMVEFSWYPDNQ